MVKEELCDVKVRELSDRVLAIVLTFEEDVLTRHVLNPVVFPTTEGDWIYFSLVAF